MESLPVSIKKGWEVWIWVFVVTF